MARRPPRSLRTARGKSGVVQMLRSGRFHDFDLWRHTYGGQDLDLAGVDLSGAHLPAVNLSKINLAGADLTGANLTSANLTGSNLKSANLVKAQLYQADLIGTELEDANLTDATGLIEEQLLSAASYTAPPFNLPAGLVWPHAQGHQDSTVKHKAALDELLAKADQNAEFINAQSAGDIEGPANDVQNSADALTLDEKIKHEALADLAHQARTQIQSAIQELASSMSASELQAVFQELGSDIEHIIQSSIVDAVQGARWKKPLRVDPIDRNRLSDLGVIHILDRIEVAEPESVEAREVSLEALAEARTALAGCVPHDRKAGGNAQQLPLDGAIYDTLMATLDFAMAMQQPTPALIPRVREIVRQLDVLMAEIIVLLGKASTAAAISTVTVLGIVELLKLARASLETAFGL